MANYNNFTKKIWKKKSKIIFYLIPLLQMAYLEYQTFIQEIKILIENGRL